MSFLEVRHVQKIYTTRFGGTKVQALTDVNFTVEKGEYVAIMGESGSGKTTLLNILAALDKPTGGEVVLDGRPLSTIPEREPAIASSGAQSPAMSALQAWATSVSATEWQVHLRVLNTSNSDAWVYPTPEYGRVMVFTTCTKQ